MNERPLGIFDSGVGGLTVLREIEKILPLENIIYFGDTARVPYGNKSKNTIIKFSTENALFLLRKKVKLILVACNTASSLALEHLQSVFSIPILGVIEAGARQAVAVTRNKKIGIIGTKSTIASRAYERAVKQIDKTVQVYGQSCPLFVPLVEEGIVRGKIIKETMSMYLEIFKKKKIDTIILGCTHYPLLKEAISLFLPQATVIDSAREVALQVREILVRNRLLMQSAEHRYVDFYVSDETDGFSKLAKLFLKRSISKPKIANV